MTNFFTYFWENIFQKDPEIILLLTTWPRIDFVILSQIHLWNQKQYHTQNKWYHEPKKLIKHELKVALLLCFKICSHHTRYVEKHWHPPLNQTFNYTIQLFVYRFFPFCCVFSFFKRAGVPSCLYSMHKHDKEYALCSDPINVVYPLLL